jgi:endonuclease G
MAEINFKLYNGYQSDFLVDEEFQHIIELPELNNKQSKDAAEFEGDKEIRYINYSLRISKSHKFPFFTATNIDGTLFKKVPRRDNWRKDPRIKEFQWGSELYSAAQSNFDRGHMTKREDVQWADTIGIAMNAADSTFFYSNAVPQHKDLNQDIWRSLEDYILHTETRAKSLKICVFTGPVLDSSNPYFITSVGGKSLQIPSIFWKVVYFPKDDKKLYRVGFMMSQNQLLLNDGIIEELEIDSHQSRLFLEFEDAGTYQVNVSLIEELTDIELPSAIDSYSDQRSRKLVLEQIDIDPELESYSSEEALGFKITNLKL